MEQMHTSFIKWSIKRPIDHLIKLVRAFVPYVPHISVYMYNKSNPKTL